MPMPLALNNNRLNRGTRLQRPNAIEVSERKCLAEFE